MATVTDVEVANASFPNVRQDLNDILEAITTNFSADAEPTTTYPNQFWYETDTNLLYLRNEANDAWITLASIDQTSGEWEPRTAVIQAIDAAGLSFKTDEGTTRVEIADDGSVTVNTSLDVDNIKIDGNTISSTDTNGNINITPDGTGKVVIDGLSYPTADGSDGQVLTTDGSGNIAFEDAGGGLFESYAVVRDEKGGTSNGGTFTSGSDQTRDLNTEHFDPDGIVSLSSNQFTLQAGTYFIRWSCPAHNVGRHISKLYNVTDSNTEEIGTVEYCPSSITTRSFGTARITIASTKAFEIRHNCQTTQVGNGFGVDTNNQLPTSVYTVVEIFKEA